MHKKREESGGVFLFYSLYLQQPGQDAYDRAVYKDMYGFHFGGRGLSLGSSLGWDMLLRNG